MISLLYSYCSKDPITGKGTMGESIPTYRFEVWNYILQEEEVQNFKNKITAEHKENIKTFPKIVQENFPEPRWYSEEEYNIIYEI